MIIVHHLNNSRSQRILWMLEELDMTYEIRFYKRDPKTMLAPREMRQVHPLGKSPILEDTDGPGGMGVTLVETGAICEYLVDKAGGRLGPPPSGEGHLLYRQFMHYAEGSLMPPLFAKLVVSRVPFLGKKAAQRIQPMVDVHLEFVERELSRRPWFAGGEMTAADIMMSFPLEAARSRAGLGESRPATIGWLERIRARPAYQTALSKGGEYAYAKARGKA
ncbi:glutathione S-transferase [Rhizobium sp. NTR19]|uniref:Glutathione S-transferase n=1 Tax=Neorhizobium turbinariae TaxID=2937795 RepID=A0ABT0IMA9_9HYPH|nr:glutathione S-transferase [Neorhizobium turbinariae]MCK8778999.1 glutathione S-transferase [Neorhizobium turbinariae]